MLRLVVGISGASGPQYGIRLLQALKDLGSVEVHLIVTAAAKRTIRLEADVDPTEVAGLAHIAYDPSDVAAPVSSGSFQTVGMVVIPCSMSALAAIAHGYSHDLLTRAADVTLKERRRLVLVPRETPLSLIHLRNMVSAAEAGAVILPPMPAFYHAPRTVQDMLDHTVGKVLDQFDIEHDLYRRWGGGT